MASQEHSSLDIRPLQEEIEQLQAKLQEKDTQLEEVTQRAEEIETNFREVRFSLIARRNNILSVDTSSMYTSTC